MRSLVSVTILGLVGAQQPILTSGLSLSGPAVYDSAGGVYGGSVYSAGVSAPYSVPAAVVYPPAASAAASVYAPFVSGAATIYPTGPATVYAGTASSVAYPVINAPIAAAAAYPIQNYIGASTVYANTYSAPLASATVYPAAPIASTFVNSYPLASASTYPLASAAAYLPSLPYATTTPYAAPIVASPYISQYAAPIVTSPYVSQYSGVVSTIPTMPYATRPYAPAPYVPYQGGVPGIGQQTVEPAGSWGECNRWVMGDDNYDVCIRHRGGY